MSAKRTHSTMSESSASSTSSASSNTSASSAISTIPKRLINIDHLYNNVFFALSAAVLLGSLQVNDPNSPGGKRSTHMYSQEMIDPRGEKATFESWGEKTAAQVAAFFE